MADAVKRIDPDREVPIDYGDGLRECRKMLMLAKAGKRDGYLLEGMACPGGRIAGAGTITPVKEAGSAVQQYKNAAAVQSAMDSPLKERLKEAQE